MRSVPDSPRGVAVAELRLITDHDCLVNHVYRIGIKSSPQFTLFNAKRSYKQTPHDVVSFSDKKDSRDK